MPAAAAAKVASLPPTSTVFGAFLGYNPIRNLLGPTGVLAHLPHAKAAHLTGRSFFPSLISAPFTACLHDAFDFAIAAMVVAAAASWLRGKPHGRPKAGPAPAPSPAAAPAGVPSPAGPVAEPPPGPDGSGPGPWTAGTPNAMAMAAGIAGHPGWHQAGLNSDLRPVNRARGSGPAGSGQDPRSAAAAPVGRSNADEGEHPGGLSGEVGPR